MYIPALDVVQGLPEVDIEAEMADVAQMDYSVTRAKNAHLRDTLNQFRLSEIEAVVFTGEGTRSDEAVGEYERGSLFLRFGDAFEYPISMTPTDGGLITSSFTDYVGDVDEGVPLSEESWAVLAEMVRWGDAGDDSVPCPVEPKDLPPEDCWHVWNSIIAAAYGPNKASPEVRIILELAQYIAGDREDARLCDI
jgi:hypothetical protein